jgi:hypothetical protein
MTTVMTQMIYNLTVDELLELNKEICDLIKRKIEFVNNQHFSAGESVYCQDEISGRFWALVEKVDQSHAHISDAYGNQFCVPLTHLNKI